MPIATGTKLGQYEVQEFIGQGAMGLVYRAYHVQLERPGAVKVLQSLAPDPDTTARFRHEAQAIAQMRHSNIVNVYDFGEFEGTPYMIVEYVPGGSLANRLSHGRVDQAAALKYLRGIAAGLDYAHGLGIVHRDVKPANVLLEKDDTPVLADFGLAKLLQGTSLKSMTGVTTGTPAYMAPEQVMGHQVGPAADRYSLATIAYEMLTGFIPFDGEGLMELLYAQVHREPSPPSVHDASLGPAVDAVMMRGLAKDPAARWESCTAFVDALAAALASPASVVAHNGVPATSATDKALVLGRAVAATVPLPPLRAVPQPAPQRRRRQAPATMVMPLPGPPVEVEPAAANGSSAIAHETKARRRPLMIAGAAGLVLLLLLGLGVCAAVAAQAPTLALSPSTVAAGGRVLVTAERVPANKAGEIRLLSQVTRYPFRASGGGAVKSEIVVPEDIELGDHTVQLCWDSNCRAQRTLRVVAAGTVVSSPPPGAPATPSAGTSPQPGQSPTSTPPPGSTPGSTPRPGASPTSAPTNPPSPVPSPPKPTPTPTPPPLPAASVTASPSSGIIAGATAVTVKGANFTPARAVTITLSRSGQATQTFGGVTVQSDGSFTKSITPALLTAGGSWNLKACDSAGRCASTTISIL
jgi:serine/threonine-protein kinase